MEKFFFGEDEHKPYLAYTNPLVKISPLLQGGMEDLLEKNLKLIIFGGKGGVGKTSIASAAALQLAQHNKEKKVLIFFQLIQYTPCLTASINT